MYFAGQNKALAKRYTDVINPSKAVVDDRTGDEVARDVIERLGLKNESI